MDDYVNYSKNIVKKSTLHLVENEYNLINIRQNRLNEDSIRINERNQV